MEECGLLVKAEFFGQEDTHPEVLTYDSREVTENTMFICKGAAFKEEYLTSAVEREQSFISVRKSTIPGRISRIFL